MSKPKVALGRPSDAEALKLVLAYYSIMEPEKRSMVMDLAEKLATESQVIEGVTHFVMLEPAMDGIATPRRSRGKN